MLQKVCAEPGKWRWLAGLPGKVNGQGQRVRSIGKVNGQGQRAGSTGRSIFSYHQ